MHLSKRDTFLLRIDPRIMAGLKRWADDDLRSVNGQVEFILRDALLKAGRLSNLPEIKEETTKNTPYSNIPNDEKPTNET